MKKILFLLMLFNFTFSQSNNENAFIGKWQVVPNSNTKNIKNKEIKEINQAFDNGFIEFELNNSFKITLKSKSEFALMLMEMTKNNKWRYNRKKNQIMVGTDKDNYTIIGFEFFTKNNEYFFKLLESEIILKVLKIE
jgi:hypothetical protein